MLIEIKSRVPALLILCLAACGAFAMELPPELSELAPLVEEEKAFTDALRALDHKALADLEALKARFELLMTGGDVETARGTFEEARARIEQIRKAYAFAVERFPRSARLHNYRGELIYDQYGEEEEGLKEWHKAISLDPKLGDPYNNLGIHYMHSGAYELGLKNLDKALEIDGDHPDYLFNMVQAYLNHAPFIQEHRGWKSAKLFKEAMKLSKRAVRNAPDDFELRHDYAINFWRAEALGVKAEWKDAAKAWEEARKVAGDDTKRFNAWLNEARAWIKAEKDRPAIECLEEALEILPDSDVAKRLLEKLREDGNG